jgi:hypothetical protein
MKDISNVTDGIISDLRAIQKRKICNYCEGENQDRSTIMYDDSNNPIMVWNENGKDKLLLDDSNSELTSINYCPMCGRKL